MTTELTTPVRPLSAEEMRQIAGGASDMFLTLEGIKGESKR